MFDLLKIDKLFFLMKEKNLDAVVIGPSNNLEYISGFNPGGCERFQALVLTGEKKYFYICNRIYAEDMKRWFPKTAPFYVWNDAQGFHGTLEKAFNDFCLDKMRIAAQMADIDKQARALIERHGLGQYFLNRTGHGIGFDVHEAPCIFWGVL